MSDPERWAKIMKYLITCILLSLGLVPAVASEGKIIQKEGVYLSPEGTSKLVLKKGDDGISVRVFTKWGKEESSVSYVSKHGDAEWVCFQEGEKMVWFYDGLKSLHAIRITGVSSSESEVHEVTRNSEIVPKALVGFIK